LAAVVAAALLSGACVGSEATPIGPRRPSRPPGCAVEILPGTPVSGEYTAVASARAQCAGGSGRNACMAELRRQACLMGADVAMAFSESVSDGMTYIAATLAVRAPSAPRPATSAATPGEDCNPICSPGFACRAGQCIPQCNPPCEAGEVCTRKRICEAAPHP
jgi:hypothetical protein